MSDKTPLRVLFCMGVNQNFMDGTADEMKDVWGAFVSMMQGIARLPGVRVLGVLDAETPALRERTRQVIEQHTGPG